VTDSLGELDIPVPQIYLSTMISHLKILFLLFTLIGCADQGTIPVAPTIPDEPPTESSTTVVPGVIGVIFTEGTTLGQAEQLVKDLNLTFKFPPTGSPVSGVLSVPIGSEDKWVEQFKTYAIVKSADRVCLTLVS
jgi:hypothetical protein